MALVIFVTNRLQNSRVGRAWEAMRVAANDTCRPFSANRRGLVLGEGAAVQDPADNIAPRINGTSLVVVSEADRPSLWKALKATGDATLAKADGWCVECFVDRDDDTATSSGDDSTDAEDTRDDDVAGGSDDSGPFGRMQFKLGAYKPLGGWFTSARAEVA